MDFGHYRENDAIRIRRKEGEVLAYSPVPADLRPYLPHDSFSTELEAAKSIASSSHFKPQAAPYLEDLLCLARAAGSQGKPSCKGVYQAQAGTGRHRAGRRDCRFGCAYRIAGSAGTAGALLGRPILLLRGAGIDGSLAQLYTGVAEHFA